MLPVLGAPILIFTIFYFIFSVEVGVAVLSIMGIVGFVFKNKLLDVITEQYRKKKYGMIAGFKEKNS